ncbi:MAG: hypothetical protein ABI610_02665 [Acidobacteriota bacterium]
MVDRKKITVRLTTLDDDDFLRDVAFWQRRGAEARFAETWRLSCIAYGLDPDVEHPMDKSVVRIRRWRAGRTRPKQGPSSSPRGRN